MLIRRQIGAASRRTVLWCGGERDQTIAGRPVDSFDVTVLERAELRRVVATRYTLPLREGGSLPGLVEADDLGMYVVKFRGAGQGPKALVAEVIAGAIARAIGLRVPEHVLIEVDGGLARAEPDFEVQALLRASAGLNLGVDYLPGSLDLSPSVDDVSPEEASAVLWFDALTQNVDRSWRNPNLLMWHRQMWLIDHGAALYFAHNWAGREAVPTRPYAQAGEHVLIRRAGSVLDADERLAPRVTTEVLAAAAAAVPDLWLADEPEFGAPDAVREAYVTVLSRRLEQRDSWLPDVEATRASV